MKNSLCAFIFYVKLVGLSHQSSRATATPIIWGQRPPAFTGRAGTSTSVTATFLKRLTFWRGGDQETSETVVMDRSINQKEELSLDEKVQLAMEKLGLAGESPSTGSTGTAESDASSTPSLQEGNCEGGVCSLPANPGHGETSEATTLASDTEGNVGEDQLVDRAAAISKEMGVDESLVMAAFGATVKLDDNNHRSYNELDAKALIQHELDLIATIPEDSEQVRQLVGEGHDVFFSRRALAFAEMNMDDARAILLADDQDMAEEEEEQLASPAAPVETEKEAFKTITVESDFDPTKAAATTTAAGVQTPPTPPAAPTPAKKSEVVFEATTAQIQELVLESPVPVLLDVYANWCGPCKVLGPALEEMAVKSGGIFRLVKVNSDNEKPVAAALGVTALPTVFGIRDGKILHMFQGMPRDEEFMKNFMMGLLMPGASFTPPVTTTQKKGYEEMTAKLVKMAGAACFSFSARERLQDRIASNLDKLVAETGDASRAEESALLVRALLSNVIKNPYESKFRTVNLLNPKVAAKVASYPSALAMLKGTGFTKNEDGNSMKVGKDKKVFNVAPLMVARDAIDKWIDQSRYEIAKAARKRKDEEDRARLEAEGHFEVDEEEDEDENAAEELDVNKCQLKVRMDGKKKILDMSFAADDPVFKVVESLGIEAKDGEEVQITCVAKKLVLKSTNEGSLEKTFRELNLSPSAAIVVSIMTDKTKDASGSTLKLSEKAALKKKKKKKGSHTMQSVGIYAKDDNAKAELIDGGGGVWYEHDVTDDEEDEGGTGQEEGSDGASATEDGQVATSAEESEE